MAYYMRISDWSSDVCSSDLQIFAHVLAEFRVACAAAEIGRPASREEGFAQRFAENVAHVGQAEVLQHHGRAGNGAGRIGNVEPGDIDCRAMDRLEKAGSRLANARRAQQPDRAADHRELVRQYVAEHIPG